MSRKKILARELNSIKDRIVKEYQPEKIIVFGSFVSGEIKNNSDLDIMILKDTKLPFLQRLKEVALISRPKIAVDFLVYTPREYQAMSLEGNYFFNEIINGLNVYIQQHRKNERCSWFQ